MNVYYKIIMFLLFAVTTTAGMIVLKIAMSDTEGNYRKILHTIFTVRFLVGFMLYVIGFITWLYILSQFRLNIVYPIATSLLFVMVNLGSYIVFKDKFTKSQLIGTIFCLVGIILLSA